MRTTLISLLALTPNPHAQDLDIGARVQPLPADNRFADEGFFVWFGAPVEGSEGKCHPD